MESVYRSVAGIDVHKKMLAVVIRRQIGERAEYEKRKFGTTRAEIQHLQSWLGTQGVSEVVMESTAQYWRPVWYGLEPHFPLHLTHPLKTRAPRGRKSDFRDAQRLADRWSAGDLEDSFVPGSEQRAWRWLTRTRVQLKKELGVIHNHVEGLLEQGGIKLSAVVSDLFGVSGWAMLEHLARGVTEVEVLAGEARGALRKKNAELKEALAGRLEPVYRLLLSQHMDQVRLVRRQVEEINQALVEAMKEHVAALHRLTKIPGVDLYAAQELVSEIGPRAAAFASALFARCYNGSGLQAPDSPPVCIFICIRRTGSADGDSLRRRSRIPLLRSGRHTGGRSRGQEPTARPHSRRLWQHLHRNIGLYTPSGRLS